MKRRTLLAGATALATAPAGLAHLLLVDNPPHHPEGDFALDGQGLVQASGEPRLTFSGIGVFRRELLDGWRELAGTATGEGSAPIFKLRQLLLSAMARQAVSGTHHRGIWTDVGTPERLAQLSAERGDAAVPRRDQRDAGFAES